MRIAALAENGLTFSKNPFELDRYKKLRDVAAELFALLTDRPLHELKMELGREVGYVTPKVEVRGALIDEGDRLLMMREVADGRWSLPGGFADLLDTPSEAVVREVREETGYGAEVMKLVGCWDRDRRGHTPKLPKSGGRRESHPPAPTEPCVTVSRHTALTTLSASVLGSIANGRIRGGSGHRPRPTTPWLS
jgi:Hydrolase of X-linked nucleoside diphosphate N terminal/NUDIX domain